MSMASMVITFAIPIRSFQTPVRKVAIPENGGAIVLMTAMAVVLVCGGTMSKQTSKPPQNDRSDRRPRTQFGCHPCQPRSTI
jgi:hypothetical protein